MISAHSAPVVNPFAAARGALEGLISRLEQSETCALSHGQLEELIGADGREVLRLLLQGHLDLRGIGDVGPAVEGADGVRRTCTRLRSRQLLSLFGLVVVSRLIYGLRAAGPAGLAPMDASLNLPQELYSHGVRRRVAVLAARGSYDQTVELLAQTTGAPVPKRQAEELAGRAAVDFDEFYTERAARAPEQSVGGLLVITVDAKGIVMRPEGLREQTRAAAEKQQHKLKRRLTKGEKANRKRMATVAAVYTIEPDIRSPEVIVDGLQGTDVKRKRPKPLGKRVWASLAKQPADIIEDAFQEALKRDPDRSKRWVAVVDGNKTQLRLLREAARRHGVDLTIVVDIIHVIEYLWDAARVFHAETEPAGEEWVNERLRRLLKGQSSLVAGGIRRSATKRKLSSQVRKAADKCANYLMNYKEYLHYDEYLAAGLPIASGVIEGACRHLIKDRMDITGAKWGLRGAEAVLKLRALQASGDFDEYWVFHESCERSSNHDAHYAGGLAPDVAAKVRRGRPDLRLVKS